MVNILKFLFLFCYMAITNGAEIRCYERSFDFYTVFQLDNPTPFLNSSSYEPERKTVFFVFGFTGKPDDPSVQRLVEVYLRDDTTNICILNWEDEAASGIFGPLGYPLRAVENAKRIGTQFGQALIKLFNAGLNLSRVHLIGFSLGAQLSGYAGREVQKNGTIVGRITGLDAAGPLYDGIISLNGLSAADASFVDIIHTNPGLAGSDESTGTVDIWPNCESNLQPGCSRTSIIQLTEPIQCSHDRSWMYFAEAVERPAALEARLAAGCSAWREGRGADHTIYVGDNTDTDAHGNYFLRTNSDPQYGRGEEGSQPAV